LPGPETIAAAPGTAAQSDVGALRSVIVKHVRDAFQSDASVDREWQDLGYAGRPDFARALDEYDRFLELLANAGAELRRLSRADGAGLDSLYTRDAAVVCERGVILCSMGKPQRRAEPAAVAAALRDWGIPVHGAVGGEGRLEGGDVVWIDARTIAVGRGYRTNDAGIRQLRELLRGSVDEVLVVPLPHWRGPGDVFHLMSMVSPLDRDLFLVYPPLLPVPFREALLQRGISLVEVPEAEFGTLGCNVLAVAPRRAVMVEGNPLTRARLERAGVEVHEFSGREICVKGGGGPTCLTRPIARR